MKQNVKTIFDRLTERNDEGRNRWGIGTADVYLRQVAKSLAGTVTPDEWKRALKDASERLTYCSPDMQPTGMDIEPPSGLELEADFELKAVRTATGDVLHIALPITKRTRGSVEGAIGEFDAIVTSSRVDRDNDILEPKGAQIDPKLPLLWQHTPWEPIGKLVEVLVQNSKRIKARFAFADTALARDALVLVEFGALRISHGFHPIEWEDRTSREGDWLGFHILKYEMLEVSLVSVPSNVDAVITAFTSDKLTHPSVKGWAKSLHDARPTIAKGVTLATGEEVKEVEMDVILPEAEGTKAGRSLSKANETRLTDALADTEEIINSEGASRSIVALAERVKEKLEAVLDSLTSDEGEEGKQFEATVEKTLVGIGDVLAFLAVATKDDASRAQRVVSGRLTILDREELAGLLDL